MILIKRNSSTQLSRLYRIIYCKSIDDFFRSHNLFLYLDYSLESNTVQDGTSLIEITFHTKVAEKHADKLRSLPLNLTNESIALGSSQIIAQIKKPISAPDITKVKHALVKLHRQPWLSPDDINLANTKEFQLDTAVFTLGQGKARSRQLTTALTLDSKIAETQPELLPLFTQLTGLIQRNCLSMISYAFGFFGTDTKELEYQYSPTQFLIFHVPPTSQELMNNPSRLRKVLTTSVNIVHFFQAKGVFNRLTNELRSGSRDRTTSFTPNSDAILTDTGAFIGATDWQKIATIENCNLLLENTVITVKYGRKHVSLPILPPRD